MKTNTKFLIFISCLFSIIFTNPMISQETLCLTYGSVPYDIVITGTQNASDIDFLSFENKHIRLEGSIVLDSDITFKNAVISVNKNLVIDGDFNSLGHTVTFDNCKVYRCGNPNYSFLYRNFSSERQHSLIVENCEFENFLELFHITFPRNIKIKNNSLISPGDDGHALHVVDYEYEEGVNSFEITDNIFSASAGLWLDGCEDLEVQKNKFINCSKEGIHYLGRNRNIKIFDNEFENCQSGITMNFLTNTAAGYHIFTDNLFTNVETAFEFGKADIFYANNNILINSTLVGDKFFSGQEGNYYFQNNEIYENLQGSTEGGFHLSGIGSVYGFGNVYDSPNSSFSFKLKSKENTKLTENVSTGGMFFLDGIDNIDLYDNEVDALNGRRAYSMSLSNGRLCKNKGENAYRAFSFTGNCMNTNFSNNAIGLSETGLFINDVIGQQYHKANIWNASYNSKGAINTSNFPVLSLFTVNSDVSQGGNLFFKPQNGNYSPTQLFDEDVTVTSFENCSSSNIIDPSNPISNVTFVDGEIISGNYDVNPLSNWLAERNLLRKLIDYPDLLDINPAADNWYLTLNSSGVHDVAEIESILSEYYGTSSEVSYISDLFDDYTSDPTNASIYLNAISSVQESIVSRQATIYNQVKSLVTSIGVSNEYEELFQDIISIYIEYIDDEAFIPSPSELQFIAEAANLCPMTYGPSIYIAQSIADAYEIGYDEENCNDSRVRNTKGKYASNLKIYPNPALDRVTIQTDVTVDEYRIYDMHNRLVKVSNESSLSISELNSGVFFVKSIRDGQIVDTAKFLKVK